MPQIDLLETQKELQWLEKKLSLTAGLVTSQKRTILRGQVYQCDFGHNVGSELRESHPCVVVQNDSSAPNSLNVCVVPITHAYSRKSIPPVLVPVTQQTKSTGKIIIEGYANVAQIRCVSKGRLHHQICVLTQNDMQKIDIQIASFFGLYHYYQQAKKSLKTASERAVAKEKKIKQLRSALTEISGVASQDCKNQIQKIIDAAMKL